MTRLRSRNGPWVILGLLVATTSGLATNILVPRALTVDETGQFFFLLSFVVVAPFLLRFGLDRSVVRDVSIAKTSPGIAAVARTYLVIGVATGLTTFALALVGWEALARVFSAAELPVVGVLAMAVWLSSETSRLIFSEALRGRGAVFAATWLGRAGRAMLLLVVVGWATLQGEVRLELILWGAALTNLVLLATAMALYVQEVLRASPSKVLKPLRVRATLAGAWPFYLTSVWSILSNQGDLLVAGAIVTLREVALYAAGLKLVALLHLPAVAATQYLSPLLHEMLAGSPRDLEKSVRRVSSVFGLPVVIASVCMIVFASQLFKLVYPAEYADGAKILVILSLGQVALALAGPAGFVLLMGGHGGTVARITSLVSAAQFAMMTLAAWGWGIYGLATASSLGSIALAATLTIGVRRRLGISTAVYWQPRTLVTVAREVRGR